MGKRWFQWLVAMHQKTALQPEDTLKMRGLLAGDLVEGSMINLRLIGSMPARERERERERGRILQIILAADMVQIDDICWNDVNPK